MKKNNTLFILAVFLSCSDVCAQKDSIVISGFIRDSLTGEQIPFTDIFFDMDYHPTIKPTYKTQADMDGFFRMKIARADISGGNHKLNFWFDGWEFKPLIINAESAKKKLIVHGRQTANQLDSDDPVYEQIPKKE
jgi:hypothetical protein